VLVVFYYCMVRTLNFTVFIFVARISNLNSELQPRTACRDTDNSTYAFRTPSTIPDQFPRHVSSSGTDCGRTERRPVHLLELLTCCSWFSLFPPAKFQNLIAHYVNYVSSQTLSTSLTLILLMSYMYGAPCKARNFNVVHIWT
jgi:hypothetical protein